MECISVNITWQSDWQCFAAVLQDEIAALPCISKKHFRDISAKFSGQKVLWQGVLEKKSIGAFGEGTFVVVRIPEITLDFQHRDTQVIDSLSLAIDPKDGAAVDAWSRLPVGSSISFSASFADNSGPFPAIELIQLDPDKILVSIRLSNATVNTVVSGSAS